MEKEIILSGMLVAGFGFKRFLHCSKGKKERMKLACSFLMDTLIAGIPMTGNTT